MNDSAREFDKIKLQIVRKCSKRAHRFTNSANTEDYSNEQTVAHVNLFRQFDFTLKQIGSS